MCGLNAAQKYMGGPARLLCRTFLYNLPFLIKNAELQTDHLAFLEGGPEFT